jgi:hypothetical protein
MVLTMGSTLHCSRHDKLPIEVDGGPDGLKFVPNVVLNVADRLSASYVVINISSLSNVRELGRRLTEAGFGVVRIVACIAPLEGYAQECLPYLAGLGFPEIYGPPADSRQIIYAVTANRGYGIYCATTFDQVRLVLKPDASPVGTIVEGIANW